MKFDATINYNRRGSERAQNGDYRGALEDFNRAIVLNPTNAIIYHNRGVVHRNITNYPHAIFDFDTAIATYMLSPTTHNNSKYIVT